MNFLSVIDQSANLQTINHMSQTYLYKIPLVISLYPFRSKAIMNKQQLEGCGFYSVLQFIQSGQTANDSSC